MPRIDKVASVYVGSPLSKLIGPKAGTCVPILMYHSISHNLFGKSHPFYHINTIPSVFSAQMRWLRNSGYRTISLSEAWEGLVSGTDLRKTVVLTFSDGYRDFYTDAMDVLTQCGFKATLFLATDRIGNTAVRIEGADYLTWNEVRALQKAGIEIGSHSVTNSDLRSVYPEQIEYELGHSKDVIEQNLGVGIDSFCYPFAFPEEDKNFTRFLADELQNLGFEYGVCTILGRAGSRNNRFFLPLLPMNTWDDSALLQAKLDGGYDWLHWAQFLKKSILHNPTLMQQDAKIGSARPAQ